MKRSRDIAWLIRYCKSEPNCYRYLRKKRGSTLLTALSQSKGWRHLGPFMVSEVEPFCLKCPGRMFPYHCRAGRSPQLWTYPQPSGWHDYICRKCRFHFNDLTASPLHNLRTPLSTYFRLVFLLLLFRDIATPVLAALCDINPKTALRLRNCLWFIAPEDE